MDHAPVHENHQSYCCEPDVLPSCTPCQENSPKNEMSSFLSMLQSCAWHGPWFFDLLLPGRKRTQNRATVGLLCPRGSLLSADFQWVLSLSAVFAVRGLHCPRAERKREREESKFFSTTTYVDREKNLVIQWVNIAQFIYAVLFVVMSTQSQDSAMGSWWGH
jgi:hypothetical protein